MNAYPGWKFSRFNILYVAWIPVVCLLTFIFIVLPEGLKTSEDETMTLNAMDTDCPLIFASQFALVSEYT